MKLSELFFSINEPYAAGLFELENEAPIVRYANALKRFYELAPLPPYLGGQLYPAGSNIFTYSKEIAIVPRYSLPFGVNYKLITKKNPDAAEAIKKEQDLVVSFKPICST